MLYDLEKRKSVYEYNASTYFTPASNTKIFTFFTALSLIGDSIPGLYYQETGDSLNVWGTGDPSFLNGNVSGTDRVYAFLHNSKRHIYFSSANFRTSHFGPGWAWDDYADYYSAERSPFPIYGNVFYAEGSDTTFLWRPSYFRKLISFTSAKDAPSILRRQESNLIEVRKPATIRFKKEVPFKIDDGVVAQLLSDTIYKTVQVTDLRLPENAKTIFSQRSDSLYRVMMQDSDNFIAEQLLLVVAGIISDTLKTEIAIDYSKKNLLNDLPDEPIWVDGSGLSRYNLFTPRSIVRLWEKIYDKVPRHRLFPLLASGGKAGTIRNWYKADEPFIYGKTGSLSNNHCLSGYLITRSGKTLIFSFMNSNFTASTNDIRRSMQSILNLIYEEY